MVIAIVSNAWDDSNEDARAVFWQSRVEVLFQYKLLKRCLGTRSVMRPLFDFIDRTGFCGKQTNKSGEETPLWKLVISFIINLNQVELVLNNG